MGGYKIKFNIEITDESDNTETHPVNIDLETHFTEEDDKTIDSVEQTYLRLNKEVIRKAVAKQLELISKKKLKNNNKEQREE